MAGVGGARARTLLLESLPERPSHALARYLKEPGLLGEVTVTYELRRATTGRRVS